MLLPYTPGSVSKSSIPDASNFFLMTDKKFIVMWNPPIRNEVLKLLRVAPLNFFSFGVYDEIKGYNTVSLIETFRHGLHSFTHCVFKNWFMLLAVRISSYGCTWEVWRALKKLELLSAAPRATLTPLSCSPNFPRASITRYTHAKHEPRGRQMAWNDADSFVSLQMKICKQFQWSVKRPFVTR